MSCVRPAPSVRGRRAGRGRDAAQDWGASAQAERQWNRAMDPIHQFEIKTFFPIARIGGSDISFTNSALFMLLALAGIAAFFLLTTRSRAIVPGRLQSLAEMSYEFIAGTVRSSAGTEGMRFLPFVFSLFTFVLFANMIGMIP